ncbi:DMT family transporter [Paenibacillus pasadenensis]|nr:EamA family transporter [Paenibacillus pasadenensis]
MTKPLAAALVTLSLIWGGSFFFIKILLEEAGPWMIAFLRAGAGLVAITAVMLALRQPFSLRSLPWLPMAVMATFNTTVPWALIPLSETRLTSSVASVLNATTPLWTLVVGALFFAGKPGPKQWGGILVSLAGILVLLGVNPATIISVDGFGFLCMMGATLCYGIGSQLSKRLSGLTMYQSTFGTLLVATVSCGAIALVRDPLPVEALGSGPFLGALVGLGVFGSGIAYILFYYLIQKGSPELATMVTYLVPATAILWGFLLLGEELRWNLLAGLAIILAGVFLATRPSRPASAPARSGVDGAQRE